MLHRSAVETAFAFPAFNSSTITPAAPFALVFLVYLIFRIYYTHNKQKNQ